MQPQGLGRWKTGEETRPGADVWDMAVRRPLIGLTPDVIDGRITIRPSYLDSIRKAGGLPVILSCDPADASALVEQCDGFVFTGGDDPIMEGFGVSTHPCATPIDPRRQAFERALLEALDDREDKPVLGICLGMQMMGLHAGGSLDQFLPETLPTASDHWDGQEHDVSGSLGDGRVWSRHRQALASAGSLEVVATAFDGVIEAVEAPGRSLYLGVQWHPERTSDSQLGMALFDRLVHAAAAT